MSLLLKKQTIIKITPLLRVSALLISMGILASILGFVRFTDASKIIVWGVTLSILILKTVFKFWPKKAKGLFLTWIIFYALDIAVQGVLRGFFGVNPAPSIIAESLSNTHVAEVSGFLQSQALLISKGFLYVFLSFAAFRWLLKREQILLPQALSCLSRWQIISLTLLTFGLHLNPTMLRQQPLFRWPVVYARHMDAQADIELARKVRGRIEAKKNDWNVQIKPNDKTVVLVIGESDNRNNWSWYGYQRPTTTPLENVLKQLNGTVFRFNQAQSSRAFTLPSLRMALTPATNDQPEAWQTMPDVFMLAKAAGYNITWLSNQVSYEGWLSLLGKSADSSVFINTGNWRDSATTDLDLLPELDKRLEKVPAQKELIVLHLLGQHFHYDLRCPKDAKYRPFSQVEIDLVMTEMKQQGRSQSIRNSRNEYDNAVYCGSKLLAQTLTLLKQKRPGRDLSFIYFADHGQEVGHSQNFAGHSESSLQGYTVPLFIWHNQESTLKTAALIDVNEVYTTQYLDHLIQGVLDIKSIWYQAELDPLQAYKEKSNR